MKAPPTLIGSKGGTWAEVAAPPPSRARAVDIAALVPLLALATGCALDRSITDADGDGYATIVDCDDTDPASHPGAAEICDGRDQDCDGEVDEDAEDQRPFYPDHDGDGFGAGSMAPSWACAAPPGHADNADDCDDTDAAVHPGAVEVCDGQDQDCDGEADEESGSVRWLWHADADGDGFGDPAVVAQACGPATQGYVRDASDCDDSGPLAASTYPGAARWESATACMQDADGDGWGDVTPSSPAAVPGLDCDDVSAKARYTFPGSAALEGSEDCTLDQDGDGYGADRPAVAGVVPGQDCCDAGMYNWQTYPGAARIDSETACMRDHDGDGFGDASPEDPRVAAGTDCDDGAADIGPGVAEVCDELDQDCDGEVDEGVTLTVHPDADGDGYGDASHDAQACAPTALWLLDGSDCDDRDATVHPGATEWCDGLDDDCDGVVDDEVAWIDVYADADGDGWGDAASLASDCLLRSGFVTVDGDCDDADADAYPGAPEIACDGVDQDCDGAAEACQTLDAFLRYSGESTADYAGASVAGAGDVNGDGFDDMLVGAPYWSPSTTRRGSAYVVLGGPSPVGGSLASASQRIAGANTGGEAGWAVAGAGDVNGDGYDDVLVGAPQATWFATNGGMIGLLLGSPSPGDTDLSSVDAIWGSTTRADLAGYALAGVGDVNGDGLADILMGVESSDVAHVNAGAAYLVLGTASPAGVALNNVDVCLYGAFFYDAAGASVAGAGDVDGDGLADMLVGAPDAASGSTRLGTVYLVLGSAALADTVLSDADAVYVGVSGDDAGRAVATAGDVDGDGLDDLLIGACQASTSASNAGAAYLVLGAATPVDRELVMADATFLGEASGDTAGSAVAGAGDVDGDGFADLLIGAEDSSLGASSSGVAYLVLGGPGLAGGSLALADLALTGSASNDWAGGAVSGVGDMDGDGLGDLAVGARGADVSGPAAGAAYLVLGASLW